MSAAVTSESRPFRLQLAGPPPVIVDAGVGNLGNVARALAALGTVPEVTREPGAVARARRLVLPGVGAFGPPREALRGRLDAAIREALAEGAWLLGICVGFQLLFEAGEEFGVTDGLGLLEGRVRRLPDEVPLPHIGWNGLHDLAAPGKAGGAGRLVGGLEEGAHVYFVHSFAPDGVLEGSCLAKTTHGRVFPAAVGEGRVMGTQFHPEKSGEVGLRVLANFLEMSGG